MHYLWSEKNTTSSEMSDIELEDNKSEILDVGDEASDHAVDDDEVHAQILD